jgi:hypothetical protein
LDLGVPQRIKYMEIAWGLGNTKRYYYDIYTGNQLDISKMTRVTPFTQLSSGTTTARERYNFPSEKYARYVLIAGYGNQGAPTPSPPVSVWLNVTTATITAQGHQSPNTPANIKDGNLNTRWAFDNGNQRINPTWIKIDLGVTQVISRMGIAWYNVQVSRDNTTWEQAWPFDGKDNDLSDVREAGADEYDHVPFQTQKSARYIRINCWGNTTNPWASILDVKIRGMSEGGTSEPQSAFAIAEADVWGYPVETVQDPFVAIYNNPTTAPNTDEFFVRLHAPVTTTRNTDFSNLCKCLRRKYRICWQRSGRRFR